MDGKPALEETVKEDPNEDDDKPKEDANEPGRLKGGIRLKVPSKEQGRLKGGGMRLTSARGEPSEVQSSAQKLFEVESSAQKLSESSSGWGRAALLVLEARVSFAALGFWARSQAGVRRFPFFDGAASLLSEPKNEAVGSKGGVGFP